jgi:hypothetical protein
MLMRYNFSTKEKESFLGHDGEVWTFILNEDDQVMYSTGHDYKILLWCLRTRAQLGHFRTFGKFNQTLILIKPIETLFVGDDKGNLTKISIHSLKNKPKRK